jgi:signal transduction histidine kinase
MQASLLSYLPLLVALAAVAAAVRFRVRLAATAARADRAERLAAERGRSLSLAAQQMHGIAASLSGCQGAQGLQAAARQLLHMADDLAGIAAGPARPIIREAPARLGPIVDAAIATVGAQIRPGLRHWQVDPALRELTVRADRRALEGALAVLLRRAASHSCEGDVVALRWVVASETVAIVVEDEGNGLAAADLVPGTSAAGTGTRGLDLGLSLARSLAAAHGGDIRLETAPGIGARAWLTLPRARVLEAA